MDIGFMQLEMEKLRTSGTGICTYILWKTAPGIASTNRQLLLSVLRAEIHGIGSDIGSDRDFLLNRQIDGIGIFRLCFK